MAGLAAVLAEVAVAQSREELRERFREECRGQYPHLSGPAHREERYAKVSACVQAKFAARTRSDAQRAAATPVSAGAELKLLEMDPWLTAKHRGPAEARGVIFFVRGYPPPTGLDNFYSVPYFAKSLSEEGWDIVLAKVPRGTHERGMENVMEGAAYMRRRAGELKSQGYKRVIVGGHSWGGWAALLAAQSPSFAGDALLLSAPATYGSQIGRRGGANPIYRMNLSEFPRALDKVKTPSILILPDETGGELFDPDPVKRGAIALKHFEDAKVPHLVIAKPPGFTGHFAALLPVFDYAYGKCIASFLDNPRTAACSPPALSNADFRSIIGMDQVAEAESKRITSAEGLVNRKFLAYTLSPKVTHHYEYTSPVQRKHMEGSGLRTEAVVFRKDLHCIGNQCSKLIRWSNDEVLEFDAKSGQLAGWWVEKR